ncbi:DUF7518 family protein [Haloplanus pelagicus]|jgi:uncharacterized coiled-coil protein SlyX|uniref:DUF7518 family protein n=1 Tax=Haloplanus pelagicus TaxID=2949995 RepID=UPI0020418680|nr:chromosome segregation protein SMC [Haloplanus sp. HW8-1]
MSNRVEELESQVAELQAAVDGLTEELVETRERLRQLEADEGVDHSRAPERRESAGDADPETDDEPAETAHGDAEVGPSDAEADPETEADDDSDSDGNDIIVA